MGCRVDPNVGAVFDVLTDFGNKMTVTRDELNTLFLVSEEMADIEGRAIKQLRLLGEVITSIVAGEGPYGIWSDRAEAWLVSGDGQVFSTDYLSYAQAQCREVLSGWPDGRVRRFGEWWEHVEGDDLEDIRDAVEDEIEDE